MVCAIVRIGAVSPASGSCVSRSAFFCGGGNCGSKGERDRAILKLEAIARTGTTLLYPIWTEDQSREKASVRKHGQSPSSTIMFRRSEEFPFGRRSPFQEMLAVIADTREAMEEKRD